jgi:hypothetical protein
MNNESPFDISARDWSEFPWEVVFECLPTPSELIDHELRNEFNGKIYRDEDGNLWSDGRSATNIGPDQLTGDHIVDAYHDLFNGGENFDEPKKIFEQTLEDESIPQKPRNTVEIALNMYEGMQNYNDIIQNNHSSEDSVSYEFLLNPVRDKSYVSIEDQNAEILKQGEKEVGVGESVFFFLNTVDKNFQEYVEGEVENPELNIEAYIEDESLTLDIYDNGPGLREEASQDIFDLDCRGNTGLPTADYIIEKYGGNLEVYDSVDGFGLIARFDLKDN